MTVSQKSHDHQHHHHHHHHPNRSGSAETAKGASSVSSASHAPPHSASSSHTADLHFPFRENTAARHARPLSPVEKEYQFSARPGEARDARVTEDAIVRGETIGPSEVGPESDRQDKERKASTESDAGKARKLELARMLRDVFKLDEVEEVVGELACWLLRSVRESTWDWRHSHSDMTRL